MLVEIQIYHETDSAILKIINEDVLSLVIYLHKIKIIKFYYLNDREHKI